MSKRSNTVRETISFDEIHPTNASHSFLFFFKEGKIAFTCSSRNKRFATIILALEISAFAFSSALGFSDHSAAACTEISKEGK